MCLCVLSAALQDFDPLDEEVSRYVVNLVNMCRLAKVPGFESRKADAEDNELVDHDINLDPAVRQRLEAVRYLAAAAL